MVPAVRSLVAVLAAFAVAPASAAAQSVAFDSGTSEWSKQAARTLTRTVPAGQEGRAIELRVDEQLVSTSPAPSLPWTFADGQHAVAMRLADTGSGAGPTTTKTVRVDTAAPTIALKVPATAKETDWVVLTADVADTHSGAAEHLWKVDGTFWSHDAAAHARPGAGTHTVELTVTDHAGNQATATTQLVVTKTPTPPPTTGGGVFDEDPWTPPASTPRPRPTPKPTPAPRPQPTTKPQPSPRKPKRDGGGYALCANLKRGEQCGPGNGRRTPGGGEKVSHKGWPAITGVLWKVLDSRDHTRKGGPDNDELLGHHGSDHLTGGPGHDVLWGDWDPNDNNGRQRDTLIGNAGNDWIYPSHGTTRVSAGPGRDYVWAYYGKGTIDCGPGHDTARVRLNGAFKLKGCEIVKHFCAHGEDGHGGCLTAGGKSTTTGRRG